VFVPGGGKNVRRSGQGHVKAAAAENDIVVPEKNGSKHREISMAF